MKKILSVDRSGSKDNSRENAFTGSKNSMPMVDSQSFVVNPLQNQIIGDELNTETSLGSFDNRNQIQGIPMPQPQL